MQFPGLHDTIVAVSSGWEPSPLGIVRMSGNQALDLAAAVITTPVDLRTGARAVFYDTRVRVESDVMLPAVLYAFPRPNSYTGQDLVEIHTIGNLPLLRVLCSRLLELGGRRALPGELTARAFLNGKLDARQVDGILELIHAEDRSRARHGARLSRGQDRERLEDIQRELVDLLAAIEAGIDFVEEEDVRFVTAAEARSRLRVILARLDEYRAKDAGFTPAAQPHVALVGLPNAGKSTLFNALLGMNRAIVSPVIGTTRDVLSADVTLDGRRLFLQDCAGLGASVDELDAAAHVAAERAADQADLVLWVHDARTPWHAAEIAACERVAAENRRLVLSQIDRASAEVSAVPRGIFGAPIAVSAKTGTGIDTLRKEIADFFDRTSPISAGDATASVYAKAAGPVRRALASIPRGTEDLDIPELVALELREATGQIFSASNEPIAEKVLGRIYAKFCVGK